MDNIFRDLHNSSHPTKAEFNNCFIFIQNIFKSLTSFNEYPLVDFLLNFGLFAAFTSQKVDQHTEQYVLRILAFLPFFSFFSTLE